MARYAFDRLAGIEQFSPLSPRVPIKSGLSAWPLMMAVRLIDGTPIHH
jgi:hypothetical protein